MKEKVCQGLKLPVYVDDVIVAFPTISENLHNLEQLFERVRAAGIKLKPSKCKFGHKQVGYLSFIVGNGLLQADPAKTKAIRQYPAPATLSSLRLF